MDDNAETSEARSSTAAPRPDPFTLAEFSAARAGAAAGALRDPLNT
jgi:hypothetical protein